ncbi:MAG: 50S ribosomal protein L32 [Elusimicrobia bacterium CG1_02_63_36]|nr:MAG: 50S ribosomal protein L32 [Elusimicrobia bacterium CG1_02_63_36]PIP81744.1 MAG: 50S ribosomal protein L32 [Elusimicrobia bacterium CG22_combo_CG10-13_8_21_14_all_63_91]PJA18063.1 MAG: 50S ribosomal protein L32 [Elusimicrobia bacterium CG_4_10_14_0_2_um_filter_63_34]PJB23919.1 MAG: 50S ribosomal protein L32 [Elusimicrobia bacterium CG_4_9_14_3_um_filter_62_55]
MPNPFRKHTPRRTGNRRSKNSQLHLGGQSRCTNCKSMVRPHTVCKECGFYGGKLVIAKKEKKAKQQEGGEEQQG